MQTTPHWAPTGKAGEVPGEGIARVADATGIGRSTELGLATDSGISDAARNAPCNADAASTKRASAAAR